MMKAPNSSDDITQTWIEYVLSDYESRTRPGTSVKITFFNIVKGEKNYFQLYDIVLNETM